MTDRNMEQYCLPAWDLVKLTEFETQLGRSFVMTLLLNDIGHTLVNNKLYDFHILCQSHNSHSTSC